MKKVYPLALLLVGLSGCLTSKPPAEVSVEVGAMCSALRVLGCKEGQDRACETKMAQVEAARLIRIDAACILRATDRTSVRSCPSIVCPEPLQ